MENKFNEFDLVNEASTNEVIKMIRVSSIGYLSTARG
jgi:hypothetical protein